MENLIAIKKAIAGLEEDLALRLVQEALNRKVPALEVLKACQQGMVEVGECFEKQDYFISDLLLSGEIFKQISAMLEPELKSGTGASAGKVVMGTVKGDIHNIGKDIVVTMLKTANFEVIDLGVDVSPARFVEALQASGATVLGMSGLLTLAFGAMQDTINAVAAAGLRNQVKIMIGGGTVDGSICKTVGADAWGADAQQAVRLAKNWVEVAHG